MEANMLTVKIKTEYMYYSGDERYRVRLTLLLPTNNTNSQLHNLLWSTERIWGEELKPYCGEWWRGDGMSYRAISTSITTTSLDKLKNQVQIIIDDVLEIIKKIATDNYQKLQLLPQNETKIYYIYYT